MSNGTRLFNVRVSNGGKWKVAAIGFDHAMALVSRDPESYPIPVGAAICITDGVRKPRHYIRHGDAYSPTAVRSIVAMTEV